MRGQFYIIRCDRYGCKDFIEADTEEQAESDFFRRNWSKAKDESGRVFCQRCTEIRDRRKPPSFLVKPGTKLYTMEDAAKEAGFRRTNNDPVIFKFEHCGQEVKYHGITGISYRAECKVCGIAIHSATAPTFTNSTVQFIDSDKIDTEDPVHWFVVKSKEVKND